MWCFAMHYIFSNKQNNNNNMKENLKTHVLKYELTGESIEQTRFIPVLYGKWFVNWC